MDARARFVELVEGPESGLVLDEAAFLIAAHDHPVDVPRELAGLDDLAAALDVSDARSLAHALFVDAGFEGNTADYGDPRNSFLDEVCRRRLGLPITLSVLMIEVGRRRGIGLVGVGMPGHFLVGSDEGFIDPFRGGAVLDVGGARRLFEVANPGAPFLERHLDPVGPRAILSRMLANLVVAFLARDPMRARWALELRLAIPALDDADRDRSEQTLHRLRARMN